MARPRKEIDEDLIYELASYGLTRIEIASLCQCSPSLLDHNPVYCEAIKEGHNCRNASLRRKQFEVAMHGNVAMLIWLGKQYLGQTEKVEQFGEVTVKEAIDRGKQYINGRVQSTNGHPKPVNGVPSAS